MTDSFPTAALTEERRIFVDLIEDILRSAQGVRYRRLLGPPDLDPAELDDPEECDDWIDDGTYATFRIETNPKHDLAVSLELAEREFRFCINDWIMVKKLSDSAAKQPEKWIEKRCREVERLLAPDLMLEIDVFFGKPVAAELQAGRRETWHEIADRDDGWGFLALLTFILPFGLGITQANKQVFRNWHYVANSDTPGS